MPSVKRAREDVYDNPSNIVGGHDDARSRLLEPLTYSGTLDKFKQQDLTPTIGREFEGLQVTDLLKWGDEMIRDLAITSSSAFVVCQPCMLTANSFATWGRLSSRPRCDTDTNERLDVTYN